MLTNLYEILYFISVTFELYNSKQPKQPKLLKSAHLPLI